VLGELLVDEREAARGRGRCTRSAARSSGTGPGASTAGLREPCSAAATTGRAVRASRSASASGAVGGSGSAAGAACPTMTAAGATAATVPARPTGSACMSGSLRTGCTCSSACGSTCSSTARQARSQAPGGSACCGRSCCTAVDRSGCG
jgi:hypothetical protein